MNKILIMPILETGIPVFFSFPFQAVPCFLKGLASRMVIDNGFRIRYCIWLIAYFISVEKITSC